MIGTYGTILTWKASFGLSVAKACHPCHGAAHLQIAPVVDASSSQSRTDVIGIGLSAVLLLTGLQWLSLKPRTQLPVR
eukprot:scaffold45589_cov22-Tisochrysis_lutea.AAC.2